MPVTHQKFDQFKIEKLKGFLEDMTAKGQPRMYEIFVDSLKVVPKTEDISQFENYEQYMDEDTEKVRILIYNSHLSNRNDQYCFILQSGKPNKPVNGLGEIDTILQEKLAARDREHEMDSLRKELETTREQLQDAETEAEDLRQELEAVKAGKERKQIKGIEIMSVILEGFVRRNTQLLQKIPGAEALAGLIEQDNWEKSGLAVPAPPVAEASFQKKQDDTGPLSPEQLRYLGTLQQLEAAFQQPELVTVMQVIARFAEEPAMLATVSELLNIKNP